MMRDMITRTRCYRRFKQDIPIAEDTLKELVDIARISASASNRQPLRYMLSCDPKQNENIFSHLSWAGYLKDWDGPHGGQRPAAYILVLGDRTISTSPQYDAGIAVQNIRLAAMEKGIGSCVIGSVRRDDLRKTTDIPKEMEILLVLAMGIPDEDIMIDTVVNKDIRYWRDEHGVHHVPKRKLNDCIQNIHT
ncbi:MAG: nitroreductase family protein [Euryarchaeota archaeon]|nr:nitroreductase family protein [Euryarchaeota archaeon]